MMIRSIPGIRKAFVVLLVFLCRPECGGGGGGGGGGAAPPTPFGVNFSKPAPAPAITPRQPVVYVRFTQDFNQATVVDGTTFIVNDGAANVPGTFTFVHATHEIQWIPNAALAASTLHSVTLTVGVQDLGAAPLPTPFVFNFTTGAQTDIVRPTFAGATGAVNPAVNTLDLTWAAATDASAVTYEVFVSPTTGIFDFTTPFTTTGNATGMTVPGLASNSTLYFAVRARDADGNTSLNTTEVSNKTLVSFSVDVYNGIVSPNCRSCHTGSREGHTKVPSMDYTDASTTYTSWYNQTIAVVAGRTCLPGEPHAGAVRVKPGGGAGAIADSFLYSKVSTNTPWCGVRMPKDQGPLSAPDIQTIYDWIFQGAPNN